MWKWHPRESGPSQVSAVLIVAVVLAVITAGCGSGAPEGGTSVTEVASFRAELDTVRSKLATAEAGIDARESTMSTLQSSVATAEAEQRSLETRVQELEQKLSAARAEAESTSKDLSASQRKLATVEAELDEVKYGASQLLAEAEAALSSGSLANAAQSVQRLVEKHPDSPEAVRAREILALIEKKRADEAAAEQARIAAATSKMSKDVDQIREITWYKDKSSTPYDNVESFHLYIGQKEELVWLRWRGQWVGDSWLFVEGITVKADDKVFTFDDLYLDVDRDNSAGQVWEWYDGEVTANEIDMMRAVIASEQAVVRYVGDTYYDDRTITPREKQALQNVLDAFVALGGNLDSP